MEKVKLTLPWPPSGNKLWRHLPNRRKPVLAKDGKLYYLAVKSLVLKARSLGEIPRDAIAEPVQVAMAYYPPDRRKRDAGNMEKVIYDALTRAGLWVDDSLGNNQERQWLDPERPGRVEIRIRALRERK